MPQNKGRLALFVLTVLFGAALSANAANAAGINTATIRAHVLASYPDCTMCSLVTPHGCFVVLDAAEGPVNVHLPPVGGSSCSVEEDACIEATGPVVYGLTTVTEIGTYQMDATIWADVGSLCDE
jgi:hypothetical protein